MVSKRDPQTGEVLGAAVEVHRFFGHGFLEMVYQRALEVELASRGVPTSAQVAIPVHYKGQRLPCGYRADLVCYGELLIELKAQAGLTEIDEAQVINYLRASDIERALLLNFGTPKFQVKRIILTADYKSR